MGLYDFFKGECPKCGNQLDTGRDGVTSGDIQTKMFSPNHNQCFREFRPGSKVPFDPEQSKVCIGETVCCGTTINAVFDEGTLVKYEVTNK